MAKVQPMCMDPPKQKVAIPIKTITSILFVSIVLLIFLLPPPPIDKSPVALISTIEDQLEIDSFIETQDGGFVFVVAERPPYDVADHPQTHGIACLIKTDKNGIILWNVTLPIPNQSDGYLPNLYGDLDQDAYVLPLHHIQGTTAGNFFIASYSSYKPLLIKISKSGEILWVKNSLVDIEPDLERYNRISRIFETSNGKFLIIGTILENCFWNRWDKRTWITKIDNEGVAEWSRVFDLELPGWYDPREEHRENLWLSPADELFLGCHYNGQKFLFKLSSEGNLEWNKTLHTYGDDSLLHYYMNTGFLIVNNTRLVKLNFNGEIEWITEFLDSKEVESWSGLPHTRLFITEEEEYFIVGRDWQNQDDNINGSLYKYRIIKIDKNGNILWQIEEFGWEKRVYPCSCHYNTFPVYLTPSGLLIITNDLIIVNNNGSVNTRSYGSTIVLKTLNYEAVFDNHTYFTIYQISNNKFLKIRGSVIEEWGGYFDITVEISCFNINADSLWQKNITYSFSQKNVEIPHKYRITTDNDLVMMVKEHNNTNSDHPILFMKITKQGSVPWIYRYTFTSIDPLCVNITKIDSSNLGVPVNSTNWFFPVTVGGMVLIVGITKRRRKR